MLANDSTRDHLGSELGFVRFLQRHTIARVAREYVIPCGGDASAPKWDGGCDPPMPIRGVHTGSIMGLKSQRASAEPTCFFGN